MKCPQCKVELEPAGSAEVGGVSLTVYQCDHCTKPWHFDGQVYDTALTFVVDTAGQLLDPETYEPLGLN